MKKLYLHGIGHFHPENEIANEFLEALDIGTTNEWIMERVGIRSRRTVLPLQYIKQTKNQDIRKAYEAALYTNAQLGAAAARMAIERAGLKIDDIGMVVGGCSAPDNLIAAEAASTAAELGLECLCVDINSACTTFGVQMDFLNRMIPESLPRFILVVNPEIVTCSVDYADRRNAVLFGDAGAAAVVSASIPSHYCLAHCYSESKPSDWRKVNIPRTSFFNQDGNAVQGFAIRKTTDSLKEIIQRCAVSPDELKFIGHQANYSMLRTVCERLGIAEANHWHNVIDFGNVGTAGTPSVLSQHWDELKPGDRVAISQVGAGLTWTHLLLTVE